MRVVGEIEAVEGRRLLGSAGVGRALHTSRAMPAVTVLDYEVADGVLHFVADAGGEVAGAVRDHVIAFHVEQIDPSDENGWTVTVLGAAYLVDWPGPAGVQGHLGVQGAEVHEQLFGLSLEHVSGQLLRRRSPAERAAAPDAAVPRTMA
jgi:hypothetical protein